MSTKKTIDDALVNFIEATDDKTITAQLSESMDMADFDQKAQKLEKEISFLLKAQEKHQKNELLLSKIKTFQKYNK